MTKPRNALEDPRTNATTYVVHASSHEEHALWLEYSEEAHMHGWGSARNERVPWTQHGSGWMHDVGTLAGFPVNIDLRWATIGGVLVLFWDGISRVVDYEMCEEWLRKHVPAFTGHHTNATNFGHCLGFVRAQGAK